MTTFAIDQDGARFSLAGVTHIEIDDLDVVVHFAEAGRHPRRIGPASCPQHAQSRADALSVRARG